MPLITVEGPPIKDVDSKRKLVKGLTEVAQEVYGIKDIIVLIKENPPENVGLEGQLVLDRRAKEKQE